MSIATRLRDRLAGSEGYECGFCGQRYEREYRNCLACGMDAVSRRGK